jgi:hypothetical protein
VDIGEFDFKDESSPSEDDLSSFHPSIEAFDGDLENFENIKSQIDEITPKDELTAFLGISVNKWKKTLSSKPR